MNAQLYFPVRNAVEVNGGKESDESQTAMYRNATLEAATDLWEEAKKATLIFENTHPVMDIARPTATKFIPIGGIALKPALQLDNVFPLLLEDDVTDHAKDHR